MSPPLLPYPVEPPRERSELPSTGPGAVPGILTRGIARIVDGLLVNLPLTVIVFVAFGTRTESDRIDVPLWAQSVVVMGSILYELVMLTWRGATVGKQVMGLRVVRFADAGVADHYQVALRVLIPNIPNLLGLAALPDDVLAGLMFLEPLVYLSSVVDPLLRGIHDKAAGTIVLRSR